MSADSNFLEGAVITPASSRRNTRLSVTAHHHLPRDDAHPPAPSTSRSVPNQTALVLWRPVLRSLLTSLSCSLALDIARSSASRGADILQPTPHLDAPRSYRRPTADAYPPTDPLSIATTLWLNPREPSHPAAANRRPHPVPRLSPDDRHPASQSRRDPARQPRSSPPRWTLDTAPPLDRPPHPST